MIVTLKWREEVRVDREVFSKHNVMVIANFVQKQSVVVERLRLINEYLIADRQQISVPSQWDRKPHWGSLGTTIINGANLGKIYCVYTNLRIIHLHVKFWIEAC